MRSSGRPYIHPEEAMNTEQYLQRIEKNTKTLGSLEGKYPNLHRLLNRRSGALKERLLYILQQAETIRNQMGAKEGNYFFQPLTKFAGDERNDTKTAKTWQQTLILLTCLGLIRRHIPTEADAEESPYYAKAIAAAKAQKRGRATAFFEVPAYTKERLKTADNLAGLWLGKGNFNQFSKANIIDVFGTSIANAVYQDTRRKTQKAVEAENELLYCLVKALQEKPYTTKAELFALCDSPRAKATWERCSKKILQKANALHRRPTKAEMNQWSLQGMQWIITRGARTMNH